MNAQPGPLFTFFQGIVVYVVGGGLFLGIKRTGMKPLIFLLLASPAAMGLMKGEVAVGVPCSDPLYITVEAVGLSGDMGRLSSKNDELLVLAYVLEGGGVPGAPVFCKKLTLDVANRSESALWPAGNNLKGGTLLFLLIELDPEKPVEQTGPVVRVYYPQLIQAFVARDYRGIEKYLGDEDLLGVKVI